ncbi:MAG: hypothetical protein A2066_08660 [Bacteroidetes bacterium GWB2_41_8]|nr:MAG: hypothetical protein A2066_08660 [Bacteroidetes bacterium GWB2_41_8]
MSASGKIGFALIFVLIIVSRIFAFPSGSHVPNTYPITEKNESVPVPEIKNPVNSYLLAIEVNNFAQVIGEKHRLNSLFVHKNQEIPFNFDFRTYADFPIPTIYSSPVPIFIRGHALLN